MAFEDIKKDFRNWLVEITGLDDRKVLSTNQDAPKPGLDFLFMNVVSDVGVGLSDQIKVNSDGTQTIYREREANITLNSYGANAESIAQKIQDSIDLPKSMQRFQSTEDGKQRYVVVSKDSKFVKNLTFLETGQYLQRRLIELYIGYTNEFTTALEDVGYFEEISITGTYNVQKQEIGDYNTVIVNLDNQT